MSPYTLLYFIAGYFLLLLVVATYTSRNANNESFFIGNKNSNWKLVAFGMIGTSLSGITFVSVPGGVGNLDKITRLPAALAYFQVVIGYFIGYYVIAFILLPLYYRLNVSSIYSYLQSRFGQWSYKTGASFFIISRTVGATARLYLVINVLHIFILSKLHIPFWATVIIVLLMILLYTFKGGVKTIVYTDTLQTALMIIGLLVSAGYILHSLHIPVTDAVAAMRSKGLLRIFNTDIKSKSFFLKQIVGGIFITIAMTGLDQEMMQKNISVKRLQDSQKNIFTFSGIMLFVNLLFLLLGALLYLYAYQNGSQFGSGSDGWGLYNHGINITNDRLFPSVALGLFHSIPSFISAIFIIALISALFPSADGALTALTSSLCIDILGISERNDLSELKKKRIRLQVHVSMAIVFFLCIMVFKYVDSRSIIDKLLDMAGYTYGPLLGLFGFGILTKRQLPDKWPVAAIAVISPVVCYFLQSYSPILLNGYTIGYEILLVNGMLTFLGLLIISKKLPNLIPDGGDNQ